MQVDEIRTLGNFIREVLVLAALACLKIPQCLQLLFDLLLLVREKTQVLRIKETLEFFSFSLVQNFLIDE